ncbi:MAG: bifunctional deaminase-reductase domain protein [Acidimicrobiales bacterium]|nr:bifunctional deaminase-reductase domain protein [Acidimicrobiales bacterium]
MIDEVKRLKEEISGDIIVPASHTLARTLIEHDLLDEVRIVVFPVVLGERARLFDGITADKPLRLLDSSIIGGALVHLHYELSSR